MRDESLQRAEQMANWSTQGCSGGMSRGRPWPQYRPPSGAYVLPAWLKKKHSLWRIESCSSFDTWQTGRHVAHSSTCCLHSRPSCRCCDMQAGWFLMCKTQALTG